MKRILLPLLGTLLIVAGAGCSNELPQESVEAGAAKASALAVFEQAGVPNYRAGGQLTQTDVDIFMNAMRTEQAYIGELREKFRAEIGPLGGHPEVVPDAIQNAVAERIRMDAAKWRALRSYMELILAGHHRLKSEPTAQREYNYLDLEAVHVKGDTAYALLMQAQDAYARLVLNLK